MSFPRILRDYGFSRAHPLPRFVAPAKPFNSWSAWPRVSTVKPTAYNNLFALGDTKKGMQGGQSVISLSPRSSRYQEAMRPLLRIVFPYPAIVLLCNAAVFLYQRQKATGVRPEKLWSVAPAPCRPEVVIDTPAHLVSLGKWRVSPRGGKILNLRGCINTDLGNGMEPYFLYPLFPVPIVSFGTVTVPVRNNAHVRHTRFSRSLSYC